MLLNYLPKVVTISKVMNDKNWVIKKELKLYFKYFYFYPTFAVLC